MRSPGPGLVLIALALFALAPLHARAQDGPAADDPAPAPPIVTVPEANEMAAASAESPAPGPFDWLVRDGGHLVGLATVAGGLAGAVSIGALTFLSPCCLGLWVGLPIGAAATLLGSTFGVGLARDWHCSQFWAPVLVASLLGGVAGLVASVVGVVVAQATGSTLGTRTYLPDVATGSALLSASAAGGASCATMLVGSLGAAGAAMLVYSFQDSFERERREARATSRDGASADSEIPTTVAY